MEWPFVEWKKVLLLSKSSRKHDDNTTKQEKSRDHYLEWASLIFKSFPVFVWFFAILLSIFCQECLEIFSSNLKKDFWIVYLLKKIKFTISIVCVSPIEADIGQCNWNAKNVPTLRQGFILWLTDLQAQCLFCEVIHEANAEKILKIKVWKVTFI